jgi:hypothetical protein
MRPHLNLQLVAVVHRWLRLGELWFQANLGKIVCKTPCQWKKLGEVAHTCLSSYTRKCKIGGSQYRLVWAKREPPSLKNQCKKGWRLGSSSRVPA